jgi:hypothetical protein
MVRDLTGSTFGRLSVRQFAGIDRHFAWWWCVCECGNEVKVRGVRLVQGITKSCGCLRREHMLRVRRSTATHGLSNTPEYNSWQALQQRCYNPNRRYYNRYGGRGISVCSRWRGPGGFDNFLADMGPKPGPEYWIERMKNDGNYEPGNCKWATPIEQANNKGGIRK